MSVYTLAQLIDKPTFGAAPDADRVAVVWEESATTYRELHDRAGRLAAGLLERGFEPGDRVCALMHNRTEWFELLFGLARIGGVIVPVNHLLAVPEIQYLVEDSGARWFVSDEALRAKAHDVRAVVGPNVRFVDVGGARQDAIDWRALLAADPGTAEPVRVSGDTPVLLQYTSGTTGFPKGATHTHATVMWNAISQRQDFGIDRSTVYLCLPALSWVAGFHSLSMITLWSGGTVVLSPSDQPFDPVRLCDAIERHRITAVALVPTVMRRLLELEDLGSRDLGSLRMAITGGEAVPVHLLEQMDERLPDLSVVQVYGMSEFPSLVTLLEPRDARRKLGSAGRANCVSQIRVADADDVDLPPGEVGEILTRSPATMLGYHRRPEATAAVLRGGWLHTGDLGYLDDEGFLFINGRSKELVISGGLNIYPAEIEQALIRHPAVAEAAVVGRPDDRWGEIAAAVVVLRPGGAASEEELRAFLAEHLARYKIPKAWDIRHEPPLPRTASGKLQKFKLASEP